jgi:hypothetical protein
MWRALSPQAILHRPLWAFGVRHPQPGSAAVGTAGLSKRGRDCYGIDRAHADDARTTPAIERNIGSPLFL